MEMMEFKSAKISMTAHSVITKMFGDFIYGIQFDTKKMKTEEDVASTLVYTMGEILGNMLLDGEITFSESLIVSRELSKWVNTISFEELKNVLLIDENKTPG